VCWVDIVLEGGGKISNFLTCEGVDTSLGGTSDLTLINGTEASGQTTISFSRLLVTGDSKDTALGSSSVYLIWAYGTADGSGTTFAKHVNTGSMLVNLLGGASATNASSSVNLTGQIISSNSSELWRITATTPQYSSATGSFKAWWTIDSQAKTFTMTMQGQTNGWISVGFGTTPFMPNSDVVVGWVSNADMTVKCFDSWSPDNNQPQGMLSDIFAFNYEDDVSLGSTNNITLLQAMQSGGLTTIQFSRALNTSDRFDYAIDNTPFYLTFALGSSDGFGTMYGKHYETGNALVSFLDAGNGSAVFVPPVANVSGSGVLSSNRTSPQFTSPNGSFKAWWAINGSAIQFTMWANTTGWVSVGISNTPFMTAADMIVVCQNHTFLL
jgi:hypothetical protein